ncbi:MAG: DNA glycosylase [Opitutales bacterium]|nr:DNA glycosylase [Opitutales bacterium]
MLSPFLPRGARFLMLGSFPPKVERWSMNFYYPNWQNDMWRIFGLAFFGDRNFFADLEARKFREAQIKKFLSEKKIGVADSAKVVSRLKNNASDAHLHIVEPLDILEVLKKIPSCIAVAATGQKALETVLKSVNAVAPKLGEFAQFEAHGKSFRLFRMPSSSRAYPMPLEEKAAFYRRMFEMCGI